jgi:DNA polymerase-3 subunit epsilon
MKAIFYDTETTGLKAQKDRIIELAAYDPVEDRTYLTFINPGCSIPEEGIAIHGITDEMVKDAPSFADIALDFAKFCEGDTVLIAHNNDAFDVHFMRAEYERAGIRFPDWRFMDSLKWARRYRPDLPSHKLQGLREIYGITANQAHRALDDVKVLKDVFMFMIDDLTIAEAYKLLHQPKTMQHMPFGKYQGKPLKEVPKDYIAWMKGSGAFDKPDNNELRESLIKLGHAL